MSKKLMRIRTVSGFASLAAVVLAALAMTSCGDVARTGRAPVLLVVEGLLAGTPSSPYLKSDVAGKDACVAPASPCRPVFNDLGSATLNAVMKDFNLTPSTNNDVTITRYHVEYRRADGHNAPGVDVPFPFDGAVTSTITVGTPSSLGFELVRHSAKLESPLIQLRADSHIISTITSVTFYGTDRVGNDVTATGSITIEFADFGDTP
jgi:hypothetical protein